MKVRFDPSQYEKKIAEQWDRDEVYKTIDSPRPGKKKYILSMFPYPSGAGLHAGHGRIYTATDIIARFHRMKGYDVLSPMGWDAFGLPSENAAIKLQKDPADLTTEYITNFKKQIKSLGMGFDWNRELSTTDPEYYAITQWLFIQFFKYGLLYKKDTPVFYCEFCKTGLAQEEVLSDGTHERCGNMVTQRNLPQWLFRITKYADDLLDGLKDLEWPNGIIQMQRNWIGKKDGAQIKFKIQNSKIKINEIEVFTTRVDTLFGVTYLAISPEKAREFIEAGWDCSEEVETFVRDQLKKREEDRLAEAKEKRGVKTDLEVIHPITGETIPVWVANYILGSVGTGAIMAVPAHDERDYAFATAYHVPLRKVIQPTGSESFDTYYEGEGTLVNSYMYDGLTSSEAAKKILFDLSEKEIGKKDSTYHIRDWIFSRQKYWGEPIPMAYCKKCADSKTSYWDTDQSKEKAGVDHNIHKTDQRSANFVSEIKDQMVGWFPIPEEELPLKLPVIKSYTANEEGKSPLADHPQWYETTCPHCGSPAIRETDTMPNWAGSCWYFLAFADKESLTFKGKSEKFSSEFPLDKENLKQWLPVDIYVGGAEHAVLHLLYARFWMHVLYEMGLVHFKEPFTSLHSVGIVLAEDNRKMSKSWGNVVNPDDVIAEYGADTMRVYEMFMAPFSQQVAWSTQSLQGSYRFLKRIWQIYNDSDKIAKMGQKSDPDLHRELQLLVSKIDSDITNVKFNTSISSMMEFLNMWEGLSGESKDRGLSPDDGKVFLQLLAPFAPFISDELWQSVFGEKESIHTTKWPVPEAVDDSGVIVKIPIQIQGKVRAFVELEKSEATKEIILSKALEQENILKWINGQEYDVLYIEGKIMNILIK